MRLWRPRGTRSHAGHPDRRLGGVRAPSAWPTSLPVPRWPRRCAGSARSARPAPPRRRCAWGGRLALRRPPLGLAPGAGRAGAGARHRGHRLAFSNAGNGEDAVAIYAEVVLPTLVQIAPLGEHSSATTTPASCSSAGWWRRSPGGPTAAPWRTSSSSPLDLARAHASDPRRWCAGQRPPATGATAAAATGPSRRRLDPQFLPAQRRPGRGPVVDGTASSCATPASTWATARPAGGACCRQETLRPDADAPDAASPGPGAADRWA